MGSRLLLVGLFYQNVTHPGRISEDILYYLETRGFKEQEARRLIVLGYVGDILGKLPFEYQMVFRKVLELEFEEIGGYA